MRMEVRRGAHSGAASAVSCFASLQHAPPSQIHWDGTAATSFSRSGENTSFKFADALGLFGGPDSVLAPNVQSVVVEGEVVAFDRNRNVILPFSEVAARER